MPAYDSDSSSEGGDIDGYTTTNVTLGYATSESTSDDVSHAGGHPTWLDSKHTPPSALAKCKVCNGYMSLLLQLNADLHKYFPNDERRLHVLCCRKKACTRKIGSVRAFREVRKHKDTTRAAKERTAVIAPPAEPTQGLGSAVFGGPGLQPASNHANPFSMSSAPSQTGLSNPFASLPPFSELAAKSPQNPEDEPKSLTSTFADKLKISSLSSEPKPVLHDPCLEISSFPPAFASFYLDAYPEELESEKIEDPAAGISRTQYDLEDSNYSTAPDKDSFESTLDKTFQKFSDRIAQNPEQILRYEFKGQPLLYNGADGVASRFIVPHGKSGAVRGLPRCEICGAQRVFELQLVPGLIYELEKDEAMDLEDGMEWGTVIVGTCSNNCGETESVSFREEWVGVQWEERMARK